MIEGFIHPFDRSVVAVKEIQKSSLYPLSNGLPKSEKTNIVLQRRFSAAC